MSKPVTPQGPEAKGQLERGHVTNGIWIQAPSPAPVQVDVPREHLQVQTGHSLYTRTLSPQQGKTGGSGPTFIPPPPQTTGC